MSSKVAPAPAAGADSKRNYVPPSLRKAEAAKPVELTADALNSAELFPSLGAPPKKANDGWTTVGRARGSAPAPKTNSALHAPPAAAQPKTSLSFLTTIEESIRRRAEEELVAAERELNVHTMSAANLEASGYGVLPLSQTAQEFKDYCMDFNDRLEEDERWHARTHGLEWV